MKPPKELATFFCLELLNHERFDTMTETYKEGKIQQKCERCKL